MTRRTRGMTLYEVMVAVALLVAVGTAAAGLSQAALQDQDRTDGYAEDLRQVRAALRAIERDGRRATVARTTTNGLELVVGDQVVRYVDGPDGLFRDSGGRRERLATRVDLASARVEGERVEVHLRLHPRARTAGTGPVLSTVVRSRAGGVR